MSYLNIPASTIPDFYMAVISLWFRVPQASIDKCAAASPANLIGILPLVTFGRPQTQTQYQGLVNVRVNSSPSAALIDGDAPILGAPAPEAVGTTPTDPSYIGLNCAGGTASLVFNLQTAADALATGLVYLPAAVDVYNIADYPALGPFPWPSNYLDPGTGWSAAFAGGNDFTTVADNSATVNNQPGVYNIASDITITPGKWHHLLLSFDLSGGCVTFGTTGDTASGVSSFSKLWYAIDDVNYDGNDLGGYGSGDPNMILTTIGTEAINQPGTAGGVYISNCTIAAGAYSLTNAPIPSNNAPIGLPASADFVDNVLNVEMAEFQMFTGVTLDTSVEANRRAFIAPNKSGQLGPVTNVLPGLPTDPTAGTDPLALVNPAAPIKLLRQKPDIALVNRSSNWIMGLNTGTSAKGAKPMRSAGKIVPYFPSPIVGK